MQSVTEEEFIKACEKYSDALFRYAFFKVSDREIAQDLVQDTFMKTWNYLSESQPIENIKAFFYKILGNLIIDYYRKKKSVSLDKLSEAGFDPGVNETKELEDKIDAERALKMLASIPESYRDIIYMRYVDDMSIKEISEQIGISENMVAVKAHRGFKKLREVLNASVEN